MDALLTNANCELLLSMRFPLFFDFLLRFFAIFTFNKKPNKPNTKLTFFLVAFVSIFPSVCLSNAFCSLLFRFVEIVGLYFVCLNIS